MNELLAKHEQLTVALAEAYRARGSWEAQEVETKAMTYMAHSQLSHYERDRVAAHTAMKFTRERLMADAEVSALLTEIWHVRREIEVQLSQLAHMPMVTIDG